MTPLPGADTTPPPVLTLPSDITTQATDTQGTTIFYSASATDNVDGPVTVTCDKPSGLRFPIATTTVTCTAADKAGNTASGTFTATVTAP